MTTKDVQYVLENSIDKKLLKGDPGDSILKTLDGPVALEAAHFARELIEAEEYEYLSGWIDGQRFIG